MTAQGVVFAENHPDAVRQTYSVFEARGRGTGEESGGQLHAIEDTKAPDPAREAQRRFLQQMLTKGLSRAERLIIILYYFEEMTMKEIGATLDLSESRVSQMHSSILARLKAQMADRRKEFQQATAV